MCEIKGLTLKNLTFLKCVNFFKFSLVYQYLTTLSNIDDYLFFIFNKTECCFIIVHLKDYKF